eukprot:UN22714
MTVFEQRMVDAESMGDMKVNSFESGDLKLGSIFFKDILVDEMDKPPKYPERPLSGDKNYHSIFWLLKRIRKSINDSKGAKFSEEFFFPNQVWLQKNIKLMA